MQNQLKNELNHLTQQRLLLLKNYFATLGDLLTEMLLLGYLIRHMYY